VYINYKLKCQCGHRNRGGSRYCVCCGKALDLIKWGPPKNNFAQKIIELQLPVKDRERILGAEVASNPFFLSSSGQYCYFNINPDFDESVTHTSRILSNINMGPLLGIITNLQSSPWALLIWQRAVIIFNGFLQKYLTLWEAQYDDEECFRLPCVLPVRNDKKMPCIRVPLIIRHGNFIEFRQFDLVYSESTDDADPVWDGWEIEASRFIREDLPLDQAFIVSEPFIIAPEESYSVFIAFKGSNSDLHARLFTTGSHGQPLKEKETTFPVSGLKLVGPGQFYQLHTPNSIYLWVCKADTSGDIYDILEIKYNSDKPLKECLRYWTGGLQLGQSSPLTAVINNQGENCLLFVDGSNQLGAFKVSGKRMGHYLNPVKVDRIVPLTSLRNSLWTIEDTCRDLVRYDIEANNIRETFIHSRSGKVHSKAGTICSQPVISKGKIFFLRKIEATLNNNDNFQMECIS